MVLITAPGKRKSARKFVGGNNSELQVRHTHMLGGGFDQGKAAAKASRHEFESASGTRNAAMRAERRHPAGMRSLLCHVNNEIESLRSSQARELYGDWADRDCRCNQVQSGPGSRPSRAFPPVEVCREDCVDPTRHDVAPRPADRARLRTGLGSGHKRHVALRLGAAGRGQKQSEERHAADWTGSTFYR